MAMDIISIRNGIFGPPVNDFKDNKYVQRCLGYTGINLSIYLYNDVDVLTLLNIINWASTLPINMFNASEENKWRTTWIFGGSGFVYGDFGKL